MTVGLFCNELVFVLKESFRERVSVELTPFSTFCRKVRRGSVEPTPHFRTLAGAAVS